MILIQRSKKDGIWSGPSRSQMRWSRAGIVARGEPVGELHSNSRPALAAWRLAHSCPLTHTLPG